jgi:thiamine biosynthesis lipoprotein
MPLDPGLPALDPSGYVKGWSIDRVGAILTEAGAESFCVSAGGDVVTMGSPGSDARWRVGIRHPRNAGALAGILGVSDGAVATSGSYERGDHIWTRRSEPSIGIVSATVTGPELGTADALATAVFASGGWDLDWLTGFPDYDLLVIDSQMRMLRSPSMDLLAA